MSTLEKKKISVVEMIRWGFEPPVINMLRALMEESRQTKTDGLPKPSESKQEPKRNIRNLKYLAWDRI